MNSFSFKKVELIRTAYIPSQLLKDSIPQVAFIGRSNVGKSSLINHLLGRKKMAQTSGKPGKTLSVNYYRIDDCICFVDLPGYGYAKVSHSEKKRASELLDAYFSNSSLKLLCLLLDSRRGLLDIDLMMLEKIMQKTSRILTIATKIDKITFSEKKSLLFKHQKEFNLSLIPFSVKSQVFRDELLDVIFKITEVDHVFIKRSESNETRGIEEGGKGIKS